MTRSSHLVELVTGRRTRRRICAAAVGLTALGATPAAAQYGSEPPLPPLPPLQSAAPAAPTSAPTPPTPPSPSGVAGAVGGGDSTPAAGTAGEVSDTGVEAPPVQVASDERTAPVIAGDDLPFTGAEIGMLAAIGAGLLVLGLGVRRRAGVRAAKP